MRQSNFLFKKSHFGYSVENALKRGQDQRQGRLTGLGSWVIREWTGWVAVELGNSRLTQDVFKK